jgi:hypothetical protein
LRKAAPLSSYPHDDSAQFIYDIEFFMQLSHPKQRAQIVQAMKLANSKYAKPFEKGKMASVSLFGGNWEEYAKVVLSMVIADTLLAMEAVLTEINDRLGDSSAVFAPRTDGFRSSPR